MSSTGNAIESRAAPLVTLYESAMSMTADHLSLDLRNLGIVPITQLPLRRAKPTKTPDE